MTYPTFKEFIHEQTVEHDSIRQHMAKAGYDVSKIKTQGNTTHVTVDNFDLNKNKQVEEPDFTKAQTHLDKMGDKNYLLHTKHTINTTLGGRFKDGKNED